MDELRMRLSTKFMKNMVSKIISKSVYKKTGYKVNVQLNKIDIEMVEGKIYLHADVDGEIENEEFMKIIKSIGLD